MDCNDGSIHNLDEEMMEKMVEELGRPLAPLTDQQAEILIPKPKGVRKRWMKHQPCPCGSGKKFFKCHWNDYV